MSKLILIIGREYVNPPRIMPSGELGQSSGSDLYCSVVQAVTTDRNKCYPVVSGCSQLEKSTCKREIWAERKVAFNQNASDLER